MANVKGFEKVEARISEVQKDAAARQAKAEAALNSAKADQAKAKAAMDQATKEVNFDAYKAAKKEFDEDADAIEAMTAAVHAASEEPLIDEAECKKLTDQVTGVLSKMNKEHKEQVLALIKQAADLSRDWFAYKESGEHLLAVIRNILYKADDTWGNKFADDQGLYSLMIRSEAQAEDLTR